MPKVSYTVKGELYGCEREKMSEIVTSLIEAGRLPADTTIAKVVSTGCQKLDYQYNFAPLTESSKKRKESAKDKPKQEETKI